MTTSYTGEIRMFAGTYAPEGWAFCDGQYMPIADYPMLFSLIGTTYGGDGQNTFRLPDLRCRVPVHQGTGGGSTYQLGQIGGEEKVKLSALTLPSHNHGLMATTNAGNQSNPAGELPASGSNVAIYRDGTATVPFASDVIASEGGGLAHDNMHPFFCINYIMSLYGEFPSSGGEEV